MTPTKTYAFPNGFRVIYEKNNSNTKNTSIQLFCKLGSVHEYDSMRGASHFIEHMCFKGTKNIPLSKTISENYDNIGAYLNASTYKNYTVYLVKCQNTYTERCISILSDIVMNSVFKKKEFEKEKKVLEEEVMRSENNYYELILDNIEKMIYEGSSFAHAIDELSYHNANTLKYKDVIELYHEFYRPNNMVLSIVSHAPLSHFIRILKTSFFVKTPITPCSHNHSWKYQVYYNIHPQTTPKYNIIQKKGSMTTHIGIAFRTCSQYSDDKYVLNLLSNIIGGYRSSVLYNVLRQENGLTYRSGSDTQYYDSYGHILFFAETDNHKVMKNGSKKGVLPWIINVLHYFRKHGVSYTHVVNAKTNLEGSLTMSSDNSDTICRYNGEQALLYNDANIVPYSNIYEKYYKTITRSQINSIIEKYLHPSNMSVCIIGSSVPSLHSVKQICDDL
jgi:predicted Zn-dependent peptidase